MSFTRSLLALVPFTIALALGGCSSDSSDDSATPGPAAEAEVVAAGPVTLANYANHPSIKAIRTEVGTIDGLQMASEDHNSCDVTATKFTNAGKVRKVKVIGGEGGFETEQLVYFRESGKILFMFAKEKDLTGEAPAGQDTSETRAYFDNNGNQLIQVRRKGTAPDAVPGHDESYDIAPTDGWQKWFEYSCDGEGRGR